MNFDLKVVPFSRYGSYIAFSHLSQAGDRPAGLYLRSVHGDATRREVFRLELLHGQVPVELDEVATPACLRLEAEGGYVEICIAEPKVVRMRGAGFGLRLAQAGMGDYAFAVADGRWQVNSVPTWIKYQLSPLKGRLVVDAPWHKDKADYVAADFLPDPGDGTWECAIEEFRSVWHPRDYGKEFDIILKQAEQEYRAWLDKMPGVPAAYAPARELAAYIDWSCVVAPEGHLTRPAMFMSKNWMTGIWSWDHCFNAMALVYHVPELAWDQFMIFVDNQDVDGAFPDAMNDQLRIWNFCKPPVHGWALKRMMERTDFITAERLEAAYAPLCRWTEWWFTYMDDDRDGIPQYNHGNDSGWDNCTLFEAGVPLEGPDLAAYLIIQMDVLAEIAMKLGKAREAADWKKRADALLEKLIAHSWRGDRFIAPRSGDHAVFESDSLFAFLPIILGKRLPDAVRSKLVAGLREEGRFITAHGLATESPRSPLYQPDGYWRGPIWAPSTMIVVDGLAAAGERALAREISRRFCDMAARSGMAENYDAVTGAGLRDRAYTWTSSVFLILAHEYLTE